MSVQLYYFDGRGRAEVIRIILAATGVEYTEVDFTEKEKWEEIKKGGKVLFGQVPLLEIDGLNLVQTGAIVRYLARKYNLYGNNDKEATIIDMYYEGTRDFYTNAFLGLVFMDEATLLKKAKDVLMPKYLPVYEKILESSSGKYLTGDNMTFADFGLLEVLLLLEEFFGMESFDMYPKLKEYYKKLKALDRIATFLNGPQRKKKNDEPYVATVKHILYG